jgi:subtilase family serine protease
MKVKIVSVCLIALLTFCMEGAVTGNALALPAPHLVQQDVSLLGTTQSPRPVCVPSSRGMHCDSLVLRRVPAPSSPYANPPGNGSPYTPANLHVAYKLPYTTARAQKIAVVTAFNDPNAESDLTNYRAVFGLPACTTANGCFRKVNQSGKSTPLPTPNVNWAQETSLDLDMVSAICTNCTILLVEANSTNITDLGQGVNSAVVLGANEVSNSYGSSGEINFEGIYCNQYFNHPYVALTVSSGDGGPGANFPAICPNVIAVGGTSLQRNGSETAWSGAGGGCSKYILKPVWQTFVNTNCPYRAAVDVSAVADPQTGVYTFDSYQAGGWYQMGGTSASAPIIAATYALAGNVPFIADPESLAWLIESANLNCLNDVPGPESPEYTFQAGLGSPNTTTCF